MKKWLFDEKSKGWFESLFEDMVMQESEEPSFAIRNLVHKVVRKDNESHFFMIL